MSANPRKPDLLDRATARAVSCAGSIAALLIITMTVLVSVNVVFRTVPGLKSLTFVEEFTGYLFVALAFLGLADTFVSGAHVRVSIVIGRLRDRARNRLEVVLTFIALLVTATIGWFGAKMFWNSLIHHDLAQTVTQTPLWIPRVTVPLGCLVLLLALISHLRAALRGEIETEAGEVPDGG